MNNSPKELREEMMSALTEKNFLSCLFQKGEDVTMPVIVEGVLHKFGLHPDRLESQREFIQTMINEMPEEFLEEGESFLKLPVTKGGYLWTNDHRICEQFIVMAIGLGLAEYVYPKETWIDLPGGLPIVNFKRE